MPLCLLCARRPILCWKTAHTWSQNSRIPAHSITDTRTNMSLVTDMFIAYHKYDGYILELIVTHVLTFSCILTGAKSLFLILILCPSVTLHAITHHRQKDVLHDLFYSPLIFSYHLQTLRFLQVCQVSGHPKVSLQTAETLHHVKADRQ